MKKNKIGLKFGSLKILSEDKDNCGKPICKCVCDCGNLYFVKYTLLNIGRRKFCPTCALKNKRNGIKKNNENHLYKGFKELPLTLFKSFIHGAKRRSIPFNISIEYAYNLYINQGKKCFLTDIELFLDKTRCNASLDRVDSKLGYEEGNLIWIYKPLNAMKKDFDINYFIKMCCLISDFNKS